MLQENSVAVLLQEAKRIAESKGLPVLNRYSVAPHHSGVFPVHEPLYQAWRQVWDIAITSTEVGLYFYLNLKI